MKYKKSRKINIIAYIIIIGVIVHGIVSTHTYWEYDIIGALILLLNYVIYLVLYVVAIKILNKMLKD